MTERPLIYALPGNDALADALCANLPADRGDLEVRRFPDGETYVQFCTPPSERDVTFVCGLQNPDEKLPALGFAAATAHELGARRVGLVAPYLAYMRQDARFHAGEAVASTLFARWLSTTVDWLVTVDPHLHRHRTLDAIYSIPANAVSAAPAIARWIAVNIRDPIVIGPDGESEQWTAAVAAAAGCPSTVFQKLRRGDRDVSISGTSPIDRTRTPVLVDDIISTARTMAVAVVRLREDGWPDPICVGVHALFAGDAYDHLVAAGAANIATCNTVAHASNDIDVTPAIVDAVRAMLSRAS
jgi:ribose-phosphate pyrophosphokinase